MKSVAVGYTIMRVNVAFKLGAFAIVYRRRIVGWCRSEWYWFRRSQLRSILKLGGGE